MDVDEFRVLSAMMKVGLKRRPKLSPLAHARRLAMETEQQLRRYCGAFALWKKCRHKACRRQRACGGDAYLCLRRALERVPHAEQLQARANILQAMPHNVGAPEREARQRLPRDCYE